MKTSKEALSIYEKVNALWEQNGFKTANTISHEKGSNNFSPSKIDYNLAKSICRQMYKRTLKRKCPFVFENETGRRYNWVTWSKKNTYNINTDTGWSCLAHDFLHWMHIQKRQNQAHHCAEHAALELRTTKFILDKLNKIKQKGENNNG
jgi:hypothetical protein